MELERPKEYQTIRLFAILGLLTLMVVLLFKVVLFVPPSAEVNRAPAQNGLVPNPPAGQELNLSIPKENK